MPNHIINTIRLTGDREKISELLESVKDNRFGIGSLDFNKVIPMPESLQIETSSSIPTITKPASFAMRKAN